MKPRILIIEDEPFTARAIAQQITDLGYEAVATSAYGEEALRLAGELKCDLALVDLHLAGEMDGITTAICLREQFSTASILVTAAPDHALIERAIKAQPYGYLLKPFSQQELRLVIEMALQRLRTETALSEREEQLETVLRTSMDSFWIIGGDGRFVDVNAATCRMTGYNRDELLQMNLWQLDCGFTPDQIAKSIDNILQSGSVQMERVAKRKDGQLRLIEVSVTSSPPPLRQLYCFGRDITERRHSEQALKESERHLRATLDSMPDAAALKDNDGRYLAVNAVWRAQNDQNQNEVIGKTDFDLFPHKLAVEYRQRDEQVRKSLEPLCVEVEHINSEGRKVWLEVRKMLFFDSSNQCAGLVSISRDITEQRKAVNRLQLLNRAVEQSPASIVIIDPQGIIEYVNPYFERTTGYVSAEVIGQNAIFLSANDQPKAFYKDLWATVTAGREWRGELRNKKKDGSCFWEQASISSVRNEQGEIVQFVAVKEDITIRKQAEEALKERLALRERLAKIVANVPGIIYTFRLRPDGSSCLPYASPALEEFCGVPAHDLVEDASPFITLIAPEDWAHMRESLEKSARTLSPWRCEFRVRRADGRFFWAEAQSTPEPEADGCILWHGFMSEITARKHTEEVLQKNEERLQMAIQAGRLGTFEDSVSEDRVLISPEFCQTFDLPLRASISHAEWKERIHPEDQNRAEALGQQMLSEHTSADMEYRIRRPNGNWRWIRAMASPVVEHGKTKRIYGVVQDITERKLAESELRKLSRAVEQSPASIVVTDPLGNIEYVNPYFERLTGYSSQDAIGQNPRILKADDQPKSFYEELWATITAGREWRGEFRNKKKDGTYYWEQASISAIRDEHGAIVQFIAVKEDITQRKQAQLALSQRQSYLSAIIENLPGPIWLKDTEGRFLEVNHAFAIACGRKKPEDVISLTDLDVWPTDLAEQYRADDQRAIQARKIFCLEECVQIGNDRLWFETFKSPVLNPAGEIIGITGYSHNISDRKREQEELIRAKNEAETANRAKSAFLATMSHELRTPLNVINGMSAILAQENWPSGHKHAIDLISEGGHTLLGIIEEILDFSGLQAGKTKLEETPVAIATIVASALRLCAASAQTKGLILTCSLDLKTPAEALGDPRRLQQVLVNLLHNAIKFTERGRIHLNLAVRPATSDAYGIEVSIFDSGIGIAAENIAKLFRPFSQADDSITRRFGGTGLGLVITKSFVNLMGGEMSVRSRAGLGSVFSFQVNLKATSNRATAFASLAVPLLQNRRVLILGGAGAQQRMIETLIRDWGMVPTVIQPTCTTYPDIGYDLAILPVQEASHAHQPLFAWLARPGRGATLPVIWVGRKGSATPACCTAPSVRLGTHIEPFELNQALTELLSSAQTGPARRDARPEKPRPLAETLPLSILAAEDNATNREVIKLVLKNLGYRVDLVENGAEAFLAVKNKKYDLLLLDMQMPVMDGLTAAREICRLFPEPARRPKIVALTANALPGDRKACLDAGMDDYLTKPILPVVLAACIRHVFHSAGNAAPVAPHASPVKIVSAEPLWVDLVHLATITEGLSPEQSLDTLRQLYASVCTDYKDTFPTVVACCVQRDQAHFAETIHGLKGCFMMIGWSRAGAFCAEALAVARKGEFKNWQTFADNLTVTFALSSKTMSAHLDDRGSSHQPSDPSSHLLLATGSPFSP